MAKVNKNKKHLIIFFTCAALFLAVSIIFLAKNTPSNFTQEQAVEEVKNLAEVKNYLEEVPAGRVELESSEKEGEYLIHVYEIKNGHTATFNWYRVDKATGEIKSEFEFEQESP